MGPVQLVQACAAVALGVPAVVLVVRHYLLSNRGKQAMKFLVLGLISVPVLLGLLTFYIGQIGRVVTTG